MASPNSAQLAVCNRFGVVPQPPADDTKLGIARNVRDQTLWPLNGLRHPPADNTNGWYLWAGGEPGDDDDFFNPLHVTHIARWRPELEAYLALPPGWRFLIAPDQEDVWRDPSLLTT